MAYNNNKAGGPRKGRKKVCVFCVDRLSQSTIRMFLSSEDLFLRGQRFFLAELQEHVQSIRESLQQLSREQDTLHFFRMFRINYANHPAYLCVQGIFLYYY